MALETLYRSIPDMLLQRVRSSPELRAFGMPGADGAASWLTWSQVGTRAKAIAAGLLQLGVGTEDRVAIVAGTRIEWILADLGVMCAGGATTTVYPTTEAEAAAYIIGDSRAVVVFAEDGRQAEKLSGADLPALTRVVLFDGPADPQASPPQTTLAEVEAQGAAALAADPELVDRVIAGVQPDHLATLIYTSGTTGRPKGVELLHRGWCWEGVAQNRTGLVDPDGLLYLWLPLSHVFGKLLLCGVIHAGTATYVDGRLDKLVELLPIIRPTILCGAPRIFEKIYNGAVTTALAHGGVKAAIFRWAVRTGKAKVALEQAGRRVPLLLRLRHVVAVKLVFTTLQERLGGRIRVLVSGSAPLSKDISEFFAAADLPILEGYGLTESAGGSFVNRPGRLRIGTVGQAFDDLECRIDADGEILLRGGAVMRAYHNLPEETAAAFTDDGFLRTGDIGQVDADGYLTITDRKKDLVKTSGGKYVAPSHVEGMFKAICPYTSQVVVIGQARNFCTMLVTLDPVVIERWTAGGPLADRPYEEIVSSPEAEAMVAGYVDQLNAKLNRWETIKKFTILHRDLSIEDGELTPSLKVRRKGVEASFAPEIDKMYSGTLADI